VATKTILAPESPTMMQARKICGIVCVLGGVLCLFALLAVVDSAGRMDVSLLVATAGHLSIVDAPRVGPGRIPPQYQVTHRDGVGDDATVTCAVRCIDGPPF